MATKTSDVTLDKDSEKEKNIFEMIVDGNPEEAIKQLKTMYSEDVKKEKRPSK